MLDDVHELWLHYGVLPATSRSVCALHDHEHACTDDDDRRAVYQRAVSVSVESFANYRPTWSVDQNQSAMSHGLRVCYPGHRRK